MEEGTITLNADKERRKRQRERAKSEERSGNKEMTTNKKKE